MLLPGSQRLGYRCCGWEGSFCDPNKDSRASGFANSHLIRRQGFSLSLPGSFHSHNPEWASTSLHQRHKQMASAAVDTQASRATLFVSTISSSPGKAAVLGLSPITTAKPTETPRKLRTPSGPEDDNNNEEDNDGDGAARGTRSGCQRSGSWNSRAAFSPRPKRVNHPARRPVHSASSIYALRIAEDGDNKVSETPQRDEDESVADKAEPLSNQTNPLERIQEADDSDNETENDSHDEDDDEQYDGDGEEDETLQLYKSLSGDLAVRYDRGRLSHQAYDDEDDVVQI
jgi:hypothetical protein